MSMRKTKKQKANECIQELERKLSKALKHKDERNACDTYVEIGDEYRRVGDVREALHYYRRGAEIAEKLEIHENAIFAHRAIAEILVDPSIEENAKALQHGKKYLEAANKSGKVHFIQLAYHVLGWLHMQIYLNSGAKQENLLEKGKQWCERSLSYLSKHSVDIDCDKDAVQIGQDSRSRKARLQQVLSQICDKMKLRDLALRYHNAAMAYAVRAGDHDLQYRCLLSKLNFSGDQRLKTAIELVHVAASLPQQAFCEAKFILAQEKIRVKDFVGAKWALISMLASKEHEKLDMEEQRSFYQVLITVYKTVERLRVLQVADEHLKMKINEKIADSFYEVGFCDLSLEFYKQMLNYAGKTEDKIKALVSIAETAKELDRYNEAYDCFVEVEKLENTLGISDAKKADTAICVASVAANIDSCSVKEVLELFGKAERLAVWDRQKKTIYENMLEYMKESDVDEDLRMEIETKLANIRGDIPEEDEGQSGSDEGAEVNFVDKWDELSETQILARCNDEANRQSMEERIRSEKDKKINLYGETRMHEAARGSDIQFLKMLIKMGYNINARDEGGWTPLHEAVGALKLENVRILSQSGADLNLKSNEGTLSADGERTDSGGLTPLMEACDRGATAIANLLLHFGANVTIKSHDDWTALDFLRNAMKLGIVEDEDMGEAKRLVSIMERKLKEANVTINAVPPPKKLKLDVKQKPKLHPRSAPQRAVDPDIENLHEYRKTMNFVGRGTMHDRTNALIDGLDADDDLFDEDEDDSKRRKHLNPPLDDVLIGIDDLAEYPCAAEGSSLRSPNSLPLSSNRQRFSRVEIEGNAGQIGSKLSLDEFDAGLRDELPSSSGCNSMADPLHPSQSISKRKRNKNRPRIERISPDDSDNEPVVLSRAAARSRGNSSSSAAGSTVSSNVRESTMREKFSQNVKENLTQNADVPSSNLKTQIFMKIIFKKDDGTRLKTKGMPFASSSLIGDVRKRCEEELRNDMEYTSVTICYDDCELSDDTPIELVLEDGNKILECIIGGCAKPSASQIYSKRAKRPMVNVLRALAEGTNGSLDLREMRIGQDDAVYAAVDALQANLQELHLDGNWLSASFVDLISKIIRHLTILSMPCCALESKNLRQLIGDYSVCSKLNKLDLNYNNLNDVGSDFLGTFVSLCPNLVQLKLASCYMSQSTADVLMREIKKMVSLEVLDLSFNLAVNSEHASEILQACGNLKHLDLSNTGVTRLNMIEMERKLEVLNLSLNDLHNPDDIVQWSLTCCSNMILLDLSATVASCSVIEMCLKLKADKAPVTTVLLADCERLESNAHEIVDVLKGALITSSTVRFQFSKKFGREIEELLPESYKFCLK